MVRAAETAMRVRSAIEPSVERAGLLVEDVEVVPSGRRTVVRVIVDLADGPGGVSSDQLAEVSRLISAALDEADAVAGQHTLEVSTPGTDRPLTQPRHFRRAVGRRVTLSTASGTVVGHLTRVEGETLHLRGDDGETQVRLADVTGGVQEVDLRREKEE